MEQLTARNVTELTTSIAEGIFTVKKFAGKNKERGTWPDSEAAIWALRAGAPQNGFGEAFITVNRRVLVLENKFWEAVARLQEGKNASR